MARPWLWRPWAGDVEQRLPWTRRLTRCGYRNRVEGGVDMDLAPASTRVDRHCCAPQANGESAGSLAGQLLIEGRKVPLTWSPRGDSNPRPADYEPAPLCVVGDLWCCLIPACTVVARCSCWAVTARDCQYRDSGYTTDARRQHQSVVVAQWTPPAVVDRHKGGELAYLAGDILQEAIEAA